MIIGINAKLFGNYLLKAGKELDSSHLLQDKRSTEGSGPFV